MPPTDNQRKAIHAVKNKLIKAGTLSMQGYRDMLGRDYEVSSSTELTEEKAGLFLGDLRELAGEVPHRGYMKRAKWRAKEVHKFDSSTPGLIQEIEHYAQQRWGDDWAAPLNALCKTMFKINSYRWLRFYRLKHLKQAILNLEASGPYEQRKDQRQGGPF